jgi:precorrin-3B C17-methyltransferase
VVGIGPGGPGDRTRRAEAAIAESRVLVGYDRYLGLVADLVAGKELFSSGMTEEVQRCRLALEHAGAGKTVSLICSGDAGIYGMAGLAIELAHGQGAGVAVEIIPGVTAASAAAARFGAPLMLDFAAISLSDLLIPWETIRRRLEALAAADLVVALYNPKSSRRVRQFEEAVEILRRHRPAETPVGVATAVGTDEERLALTDLERVLKEPVDMRTVVIVGNSMSRIIDGWFVTSRGYAV